MQPLLSVIIPVYNVEALLERCVNSIINQSFSDYEVFLVDDGSTDHSGEICDKYADFYSFIHTVHKENGGQSSARNVGLSLAKGKYISFVDSDDYIHPQMFEILISQFQNPEVDVAACSFERCYEFKPMSFFCFSNSEASFRIIDKQEIINNYWRYAKGALGMAPWNKIYKSELFLDNRFIEGIIYEDHCILPEIIIRSRYIAITDLKLYFYFQSHNSTIRSSFSCKNLSALFVWKESIFPFLYKYSNKENIDLAENYYIIEFKNLVFQIESNKLHNFLLIDREYRKMYKKLVISQRKINHRLIGWGNSFLYFISLISIKYSYRFSVFFFGSRAISFWRDGE